MEKGLFDLAGKVAAVTGAGSGLGRIFCEAMAEHGARVVCADINAEWAAGTSSMVAEYGVETICVRADVSKQDEVKALFLKIDQKFGRLDVLFNNAGIATRGMKIHEMPLKDWQSVIDVNLTGTFLCMQEGIKLMLRQGIGSIINISSVLGLIAADPDILVTPNYVASKHGVIGLTKSAAVQYAANNIRVNAIAPGFFGGTRLADVEKRDNKPKQASPAKVLSLTPMARLGRPEELKGIAVLLASDNASSFITGETFVVDGGWCAW